MSKISFRIASVDLKESALNKMNQNNLLGIRLIQFPQKTFDEYIVSNEHNLQNFDHEFYAENHFSSIEKIEMLIRSVQSCFANFNNHENSQTISDSFERNDENCVENIKSNTSDKKKMNIKNQNIIGYCLIDMKKMGRNTNNSFSVDLLSKENDKIVGHVKLEVYIINESPKDYKVNKEIVISQKASKPRHITQPFVL